MYAIVVLAQEFFKQKLKLKTEQEKQWKQIGSDPKGLRLQVKFVKKARGFSVADIRATVPESPTAVGIGAS